MNLKNQMFRMILMGLMMSVWFVSYVHSAVWEEKEVPLTTNCWKGATPTRSPLPDPFSAYVTNGMLVIENNAVLCDLTISITHTQTGTEVYDQEIAAGNSRYIVIPISALGGGYYLLTISNDSAGMVYGYFDL